MQRKAPAFVSMHVRVLLNTAHVQCSRFSVSNPHIWPWRCLPTSQGSPLSPQALASQFHSSLEKQFLHGKLLKPSWINSSQWTPNSWHHFIAQGMEKIWHVGKAWNPRYLLQLRSEYLIRKFPQGFTRHPSFCQLPENFPEPHYSSSIMKFYRCCS